MTDISANLAQTYDLEYPIIRDDGLDIARSFGLAFELPAAIKEIYQGFGINLPKNTGRDVWELPVPARFVIDRDGIVRAVDADPDYTTRPEPEETLAEVRKLV